MHLNDIEVALSSGSDAQANGCPPDANPYLSAVEMPGATCRTIEEWRALHDAWFLGWNVSVLLMRKAVPGS